MPASRTIETNQSYSEPSVSILIPVTGEAVYLSQAVESVIAQTYKDWELILILDRPAKSTKLFADKLAQTSTKVRVLNSQSPGISEALNVGISSTSSPFIARLDSDDVMERVRLARQVRILNFSEELGCVGSQVSLIDKLGEQIGITNFPTSASEIHTLMLFQNCVAHPSVMIKRSVFETVGLYDSRFNGCEDYHFWLRLLKVKKIKNTSENLTRYRIHELQETSKINPIRQALCIVALLDYYGFQVDGFFERDIFRHTARDLEGFYSVVADLEALLPREIRRRIVFSRYLSEGSSRKGFIKLVKFASAFALNPRTFLRLRGLYTYIKKN